MKKFSFEVPTKEMLNANRREHHYIHGVKAAKLRETARECIPHVDEPVFSYYTVEVVVKAPTRRRMDPPNIYPTVKPLVDGLTDTGIWEDDSYEYMHSMTFRYGGLSGIKGNYLIELIIREVDKS